MLRLTLNDDLISTSLTIQLISPHGDLRVAVIYGDSDKVFLVAVKTAWPPCKLVYFRQQKNGDQPKGLSSTPLRAYPYIYLTANLIT